MPTQAEPPTSRLSTVSDTDPIDDGQEEVFSGAAVARGLIKDPTALPPVEDEQKSPPAKKASRASHRRLEP